MDRDIRQDLMFLMDSVCDPIEVLIKEYCKSLGHKFIDDQCNREEHRFCVYCHTNEQDDGGGS